VLTVNNCWNCLNFLEWTTFATVWDSSGVFHNVVPTALMNVIMTSTGIGYDSIRGRGFLNTYGWVEIETGLPPPFDYTWYTESALWFEVGEQYEEQGEADWDYCVFFTFAGAQGGAWPVRWPAP